MKLVIVSDLHLEFSDIEIKNEKNADVLILSGDIMIAEDLHSHPADVFPNDVIMANLGRRQLAAHRFRNFLDRVSKEFPHVIYIAGNHEFYHGKWHASLDHLRKECEEFPNIHFLECDTVTIGDVTFIGGTLWTNMNKGDPTTLHAVKDMMNDYRLIRNDHSGFIPVKPADTVIRHKQMLDYIKNVVAEKHDVKFVVVGHHAPSTASIHPYYKDDYLMNGAYHSDLSEFILDRPQIKLWTHGHTHTPFDYMIGSTRIVCNPRGYEGYEPDSGWDPYKVVEV